MSTDSDIIARSIIDPNAFGELYLRHASVVHRYSWRRAGESVAEDVTADTFLAAFQSRHRFDLDIQDAKPWLLGIATRLLHNHRRSEVRRFRTLAKAAESEVVDDPTTRSAERIDAVATANSAVRALRMMPAIDRDCLLLHVQGELTYDDISIAMGIPIGTVRSRLNRARGKLRRAIATSDTETEADYGRADAFPHNA